MIVMRIALVYYSKTGRTRRVAQCIYESVKSLGHIIDMYELRARREYMPYLLHLNPRLLYDTLIKRKVDIEVKIDVDKYNCLIIGSPIWYNTITPVIRTFIELFRGKRLKVICFTTSDLQMNYSLRFRKELEELGYEVLYNFDAVKGKIREEDMKRLVEIIRREVL